MNTMYDVRYKGIHTDFNVNHGLYRLHFPVRNNTRNFALANSSCSASHNIPSDRIQQYKLEVLVVASALDDM